MRLRQIISCQFKNSRKALSNEYYRVILSSVITFIFNLFYAIYHGILGIINLSLWLMTMCAFYGILATVRFSAILYGRRKENTTSRDREKFVMKVTGLLLIILSFVLLAVIYIGLSQNVATRYGEITMITIATYTFYKIAIAVIKFFKQHKNPSPLLKALRSITYAEVSASLLTLQRSMLVSFGSIDYTQARLMNTITGSCVFLFVFILGIYTLLK